MEAISTEDQVPEGSKHNAPSLMVSALTFNFQAIAIEYVCAYIYVCTYIIHTHICKYQLIKRLL